MNIYIDESGSINNHSPHNKYFIIAMILVHDREELARAYKRFVSANYDDLYILDQDKRDKNSGKLLKAGGKMFYNGKFRELKGAQFDKEMKHRFVEFFSKKHQFDIYYIKMDNEQMPYRFFDHTARTFNYIIRLAIDDFIKNGKMPDEDCHLQLDERNEKADSRSFLENYLNTELTLSGAAFGEFSVSYFDSADNRFVQIADIFANLYYSQLQTGMYTEEFEKLKAAGILKDIFVV